MPMKLIAFRLLPLVFVTGFIFAARCWQLWAQLPPSNPNLGPAATPGSPPQLSQPAATIGIPPLATVPTPVSPSPSPSPRAFSCSCFGRASGTSWMGTVNASGYFAARQAATSACLSSNQLKHVPSPFVSPSLVGGAAIAQNGMGIVPGTVILPGGSLPPDAAAAQVLPGTLNFSTAAELQMCSQCTCN
jgi:hypothetical protein